MKNYKIQVKKGEGTYSNVFMATSKLNNQKCAIKIMKSKYANIDKIKKDKQIQALKALQHPNIIKMTDVLYDEQQQKMALVFQLMDCNLYQYYKQKKNIFTIEKIKNIGYNLLEALRYIHNKGVFHRDIKPENILVSGDKTFKLADFGSCKSIKSSHPYTEYIATRWYRAPECIMTDGYYSEKMDIWSIGCVLFQLYTHYPIFPGETQTSQLSIIFSVLGTPSTSILQRFKSQCHNNKVQFKKVWGIGLISLLPQAPPQFVDLLEKMLKVDPQQRFDANQSLSHAFFYSLTELKKYRKAIIDKIVQNKDVMLPSLKRSQSRIKKEL